MKLNWISHGGTFWNSLRWGEFTLTLIVIGEVGNNNNINVELASTQITIEKMRWTHAYLTAVYSQTPNYSNLGKYCIETAIVNGSSIWCWSTCLLSSLSLLPQSFDVSIFLWPCLLATFIAVHLLSRVSVCVFLFAREVTEYKFDTKVNLRVMQNHLHRYVVCFVCKRTLCVCVCAQIRNWYNIYPTSFYKQLFIVWIHKHCDGHIIHSYSTRLVALLPVWWQQKKIHEDARYEQFAMTQFHIWTWFQIQTGYSSYRLSVYFCS